MGICIHLAIAKSVTKDEWKAVYEESLKLVDAFPLAEKRKIDIDGIETICLVKSEEREFTYGWPKEKTGIGWFAVGDYEYMHIAEDYSLSRELVQDDQYMEKCEDALFGELPCYLDFDWNDKKFDCVYHEWGAKTQGEPYHMYLLAIACMIEARLGNKAFVTGDITRGQCVEAVKLANEILDEPIDIPARCDLERLKKRVDSLPITEEEKIRVFVTFYLGNKGKEFGEQVQKLFSRGTWNEYWKRRFGLYDVSQYGFNSIFCDYVLWGFDFGEICRYVKFESKEGIPQYEKFVKRVMDAKLHLADKDCGDPLKIDQDEASPYSVNTYFAQFLFAGARNDKIDRYIPIEEIRKALQKGIGDKCDVNGIIDEYLKKESEQKKIELLNISSEEEYKEACDQDSSEVFKQILDVKKAYLQKKRETYKVSTYEDLLYYNRGDSMHPGLMRSLGKSFVFFNGLLSNEKYSKLMSKTAQERCEFLVEENRWILIRDKDWRKIFKDIRENKDSFARYYPMVRVVIDTDDQGNIVKGIILNDELYAYCPELAEKYGDDKEDKA